MPSKILIKPQLRVWTCEPVVWEIFFRTHGYLFFFVNWPLKVQFEHCGFVSSCLKEFGALMQEWHSAFNRSCSNISQNSHLWDPAWYGEYVWKKLAGTKIESGALCCRSSEYCSDVGKIINAPVLHVNSDYPEVVLLIFRFKRIFLLIR